MGSKVFYGCDNLTALAMLNPECEIYEDKNTLGSPTQTTIYGYIDSTAQDYAEKYGYTFKTLDQCPWDPGMEARDNLLRIVKITPNHATIRPNTKIEIAYVNATGDYVRLKASAGEDGSYQYIIPVDITEVTVAVKGDLNSDGQLTVREARQLLRASMDSDFLTKKQFMCADLDGDGSISVREARVLLKASTDSTSITW